MSEESYEYHEGLAGVIAADTSICDIDGEHGRLIYAGYDIGELADKASFEEVCHLLWSGRLPRQGELDQLQADVDAASTLSPAVVGLLKEAKNGAPMDVLRSAVSLLGTLSDNVMDNSPALLRQRAVMLTAQLPLMVAGFHRLRSGGEPVQVEAGMGLAERFLYHLKGERPIPEAIRAMDVALILHAEHGFNASTFAARVTISTLSDMFSAITSAIGTLKGPLHGGANERVIAMLQEISEVDQAQKWIHQHLQAKQRIFGFGHRVYKTVDPRARVLKKMSQELCQAVGQPKWYEISTRIEEIVKEEKGIDANVDFYSASVYHALGIPVDLFTPIFAVARISGWTAHVMEQLQNNRLIRPLAKYVGPRDQKFVPIDKR